MRNMVCLSVWKIQQELILILNFSFVLAQEINKDIFSFDSEKVEYKVEAEYGKEVIT